jgi:hypothetical protein
LAFFGDGEGAGVGAGACALAGMLNNPETNTTAITSLNKLIGF